MTRAKEQADDWAWIVDHTVQVGQEKGLVILGLRLHVLMTPKRPLNHEDVEPLVLLPLPPSSGVQKNTMAILDFVLQEEGYETDDRGAIVAAWLVTALVS